MVCGYLPFEDNNTSELYDKIKSGKYKLPKWVSPQFRHFLSKVLEVDPQKRYNIKQLKEHHWWNIYKAPKDPVGVMMGYDRVPIDMNILKQIKALGLDSDNTFKSLEANRHSAVTTTYYLLLKK